MYKKISLLSNMFACCFSLGIAAFAGTLDTTFNPSGTPPGTVITALGDDNSQGNGVALQSDEKIVVVGHDFEAGVAMFATVRYQSDGSLDPSFGTGGTVTTLIGGQSFAYAVVTQADGKLNVVGETGAPNGIAVARYNADGSLDTSFGGGAVTTSIGVVAAGFSAVLQSDGKLVVAGAALMGSLSFALVRYNDDGTLDTSFGGGTGIVLTPIGSLASGHAVALQADGKIVVAGLADIASAQNFAIVRYNIDGSLDSSFGTGGIVTTSIGDFSNATGVALQANDKIIVTGNAFSVGIDQFAVARYNVDGMLDLSFGGGTGIVTTAIGSIAQAAGVAIQQDEKIAVAGFATVSGVEQFAVALYNTDGTLDTTFNPSGTPPGTVTTTMGSFAQGKGIALQSDGKIVVGGRTTEGGVDKFAAARYFSTFTPTPSVNACALRLINKYGPQL